MPSFDQNKELVFFFQLRNIGEQFLDSYSENSWKHVVSSILVFTSKHHDGYANFNSSYTFGWNSMSVGSQRNVIKDLKDAFQAKDPEFHFGIYYSLFEWFNPLYLKDKNGNFQTR